MGLRDQKEAPVVFLGGTALHRVSGVAQVRRSRAPRGR